MNGFYYDTCGKLREIFAEHCNLSGEQYEAISGRFIDLVTDIQEGEPQVEIAKKISDMGVIFNFLVDTKELTMEEHFALLDMTRDIWLQMILEAADRMAEAIRNGATL